MALIPGAATAADYEALIRRLLPPGRIWREELGTRFAGLLAGISEEFNRIHAGCLLLTEEADPRTANPANTATYGGLLEDWERLVGMPQPPWLDPPSSTADRRALVAAILQMRGGQDAQYVVDMAAWLGYTVTVVDPVPESTAGYDPVAWIYHWIVNIPYGFVTYATCANTGLEMKSGNLLSVTESTFGMEPSIDATLSTNHGLVFGDSITITGSAAYDGTWNIEYVYGDTVVLLTSYVADDTGAWTGEHYPVRTGAKVGDRIVEYTDDALRIAYWVKRLQPAHTVVHYEASPMPPS